MNQVLGAVISQHERNQNEAGHGFGISLDLLGLVFLLDNLGIL
jgi:hypothetical protein